MLEQTVNRALTGGLRLKANKAMSTADPIARPFLPTELIIAMKQHAGAAATPVVEVGQKVLKGEIIGRATDSLSAAVHASSSGRVTGIDERLVPIANSLTTSPCVVISPDGLDEPVTNPPAHWPEKPAARLQAIRDAGLVGLGGAVFPTAEKLSATTGCDLLILNGAECEPYISCDDVLMREYPREILRGALSMTELLGAELVVIVIERDKPEAVAAIAKAADELGDTRLELATVPTIYPAGGERQLVELLTGKEVPSGRYPIDMGCVCHNVGTAYALDRLIQTGEPLISRIVTVTGRGVNEAQNAEVRIGTPIPELIAFCGGYRGDVARLILGGSMMGYALPTDELPITKASNCIVAAHPEEVRESYAEWPCIRCGDCVRVCPARLLPQELLRASKTRDFEQLEELGLTDCIECGCCDVVCPSRIPLTDQFRQAKRAQALQHEHEAIANASQHRYELRAERLHQDEVERDLRQVELKSEISSSNEARQGAIEAAVERAKQRRRDQDSS